MSRLALGVRLFVALGGDTAVRHRSEKRSLALVTEMVETGDSAA